MVPGQMYPQQQIPQQQMYMVADGTASAGPIGMGSQPELYSKMLNIQQQPGFQAYANFPPQALPQVVQQPMMVPIPLSPERSAPPMQVGPSSPATAVYNSPSNENFNRGGKQTKDWNQKGIKWWGQMTYDDKRWVESKYGDARPTECPGIKQDDKWLLCREEGGAVHLVDHQVWSVQGALDFFTGVMQGQSGAAGAPETVEKPTTYDDVFQRGQDAQPAGDDQGPPAGGAPDQGDDSRKKDKKKKKDKEKKGGSKGGKGEDKGHGKGGQDGRDGGKPDGGKQDKGQGKGGKNDGDGKSWGWQKKDQPPAGGSAQKQDQTNDWKARGWKDWPKKEPTAAASAGPTQPETKWRVLWNYLGIDVLELPKETLEKHGAQYNWAYVLETRPWERAPKPGEVWPRSGPNGEDEPDICPREFDILRLIHEGKLDSKRPDQGLLDFGSGAAGYRDPAGNIHYKNGAGIFACPRLYAVQYHRKEMAFLRPGACYFEHMKDEHGQWYKQFYVGYRRSSDGTLIYTEAENWNGCFGRAGSDWGPYYTHSKKPSGGKKKKSRSGQDEEEPQEEDWGKEFGADWAMIPEGTMHVDVNWGPEFSNPVTGIEGGAFKTVSTNRTLLLVKGGPEVLCEQEAAKIYGIDFDDDSKVDSQVHPRVLKTLEGVVSFGLEPIQKVESLLKPQRYDDWRVPSSWKLPRAVLIAAARGITNVSEEMKTTIGRMVRRQLKVGAPEEDHNAMILLAEKIIREVQKMMDVNREALHAHVAGKAPPFKDWAGKIEYVNEDPRHGVMVHQLWQSEKECAVYVFADQLQRLSQTGKITMQEARAHFLIRCGERLKLEFKEDECYKLAHNREEWNVHITQLKDEQAKGILWWKDPDEMARLKAQNAEAGKDSDNSKGSKEGGPGPDKPPGGAPGKPSVFARGGGNLPKGDQGADAPPSAALQK